LLLLLQPAITPVKAMAMAVMVKSLLREVVLRVEVIAVLQRVCQDLSVFSARYPL